jgi:uncharacterized protein
MAPECELAGYLAILDRSGALFLPELDTLVVADLHFEKATAWAKRRIFLPPYDTSATLAVLEDAAEHYAPGTIIMLGDNFHDVEGPDRLQDEMKARIDVLGTGRDLVWITGNHDPVLPSSLAGICVSELASGRLHFTHIPERGAMGQVSGHLHPVASVKGRGRTVRRRCFATDNDRMILPSLGALTGGLSLKDQAFDGLFNPSSLIAYTIGDSDIHAIPAQAIGR